MWVMAFKLFENEPEKVQKTHEIQQYFDKIFSDLDNKPLNQTQSFPP